MLITKRVEFDAGHRIPDHKSRCRFFHGHRYVLEVSLGGQINPIRGKSDDGMVLDFYDIKELIIKTIVDKWDHSFLVYEGDKNAMEALRGVQPAEATVVLQVVPTVENLAVECFKLLQEEVRTRYNNRLWLVHVRLFETPNSWADVHKDSYFS